MERILPRGADPTLGFADIEKQPAMASSAGVVCAVVG
jgi:hypothetical protein